MQLYRKPALIEWGIVALLALTLSSCSSAYRKMVEDSPAMNWVYLHPNPKIGDFSRQQVVGGIHVMKYEITGQDSDVFEIKVTWEVTGSMDAALKKLSWHYFVRKDGQVQKAVLRDSSDGGETALRIPERGEDGYVEPGLKNLRKSEMLKTALGSFDIKAMSYYEITARMGYGTVKMTNVNLISPRVKFGTVRRQETATTDMPVLDLVQFVQGAGPVAIIANSLITYLVDKAKNSEKSRVWETIASGP